MFTLDRVAVVFNFFESLKTPGINGMFPEHISLKNKGKTYLKTYKK